MQSTGQSLRLSQEEIRKYAAVARTGISAEEFYKRVRSDGVSKANTLALLRDWYGFNLADFMDFLDRFEPKTNRPTIRQRITGLVDSFYQFVFARFV